MLDDNSEDSLPDINDFLHNKTDFDSENKNIEPLQKENNETKNFGDYLNQLDDIKQKLVNKQF